MMESFAATGTPPDWDIMWGHAVPHAPLGLRKQHKPFDYAKVGVDPQVIGYDRGTVILANQFVLPAYNKNILPPKDVPKSWEDLTDPKWKGGKLGVSSAIHHFARLTLGAWGEANGAKFVRALAEQKPNVGLPGEIHARLEIGEVLILGNQINEVVYRAEG